MSDNKASGNRITSGLIWTFGERILAQLVSTFVGIILARILMPEDYGIISIVMIFISICNVFVTSGFGTAIVQKKDADSVDFNTAFILAFLTSVVLYLLLFFSAPFIADFYEMELLCPVIRVLGIRLILTSLNTIQQAHIRRRMEFKKFFFATIIGTVISCAIGIFMALNSYGAWAIVGQYLSSTLVNSLVLCFVCGWNPKLQFSLEKAKAILSVSWKLLCTQLISTLSLDIRGLIIGKAVGATELAYYDQGRKYPALIINNVNSALNSVMLPAYSKNQDNLLVVKNMLRRSIRIGMYLIAPLMIGFMAVADNFVSVLLTDKWLDAVPIIHIFCLSYLTRPLEETCHQAIIAIGKSGTALKIITSINIVSLGLTVVISALTKNVVLVSLVALFGTLISLTGFMLAANRNLKYKFSEQLKDICPTLVSAIAMGVCVYPIRFVPLGSILVLCLQVISGGVIYIILSKILKLEGFGYLIGFLFKKHNGEKNVKCGS